MTSGTRTPSARQHVRQAPQIHLVGAVTSVLVLDLHHQHRTAAVDLPRHDLVLSTWWNQRSAGPTYSSSLVRSLPVSQYGSPPFSHSAQMYGPGRTIAHRPASRAASRNRPSAWTSRYLARARLVQIPRDVRLHTVEPHRPQHPQPMLPLPLVHPEVVQRAGQQPHRAPVQQKIRVPHRELAHELTLTSGGGRVHGQK